MKSRSRGEVPDHVTPSRVEGGLNSSRSETPCWTCRRRRVQCDGVLPTCRKCHKAGKECLGYKRPLVWNTGVASRGKMMGKTFQESKKSLDYETSLAKAESELSVHTFSAQRSCSPSSETDQVEDGVEEIRRETSVPHAFTPTSSPGGVLVDPIFQDLKPITRYYLDYFAQKLCIEAVLHDLPGQNPFRDLMSTIGSSPLLVKSMLAAAARHITNYTNYSTSFTPSSSSLTLETNSQELQMSKSSRYHALYYKQIALAQLRKDLESSSSSGIDNDIIVASISLFIWIDLLEAGKNTWRIHLEGMKKLVGLKDSPPSVPTTPSLSTGVSPRSEGYSTPTSITAHPFFFDTCITFDIMGTTLSRPYKISKPLPPTPTVQLSLLRAEKISFIGCPADLLWLILIINWKCWCRTKSTSVTSDSSPSSTHFTHPDHEGEDEHSNTSILTRIQSFDPIAWAQTTTLYTPNPDTQERIHLASAYQAAVLIYFHRVLSPSLLVTCTNHDDESSTFPLTIDSLANSTLTHLSLLPPTHPFIKSIVWPTFIAGAEVHLSAQRDLTRHLLHTFWIGYRSVNVVNAAGVLEEMWKSCDATSAERREELERQGFWSKGVLNFGKEREGGERGDWLVGGDVDWLFV